MNLTQGEFDTINNAYQGADDWIRNLTVTNDSRQSDLRQAAIDALTAHQEQIEHLGFFDKIDFTIEEIRAMLDAAADTTRSIQAIDDGHEFVLIALQTDLAELVQKLALRDYVRLLQSHYLSAKRFSPLPDQIPDEVVDDYQVGLFNRTQGRLNQIAYQSRTVSRLRCLNTDDYGPNDFPIAVLNASQGAAKDAEDHYLELQRLKAESAAAREADEVSIGGQIWEVVGWDSPTDFLWDVGLFLVSGGASKVVRWGTKLAKATAKATKAVNKLEKLLAIEERARKLEHRVQDVRSAAEKLKKARNLIELPHKIRKAFEILNSARGKMRMLELAGERLSKDYIRGVLSSVATKSTGLGGSQQLGKAATKEAALQAIFAYLDGTPLGKEIKELRSKVNFTLMFATGFNEKNQDRLMAYFALLTVRQMIGRSAITLSHKRSLALDNFVNDFIDSAGSAIETMLLDVPFVAKADLQILGRTIVTSIRKVLAEIAKNLAKKVID